ncbi:MAG: LL-diaminopimelate aminotransferase [Methanothermococcus sp.]|jgi:LL-diaminopimelate aminotransferase|uniref:LL-diaminopimelate aminotransferase n=1 Tax=Methanothermococcus TaxID=155862 RepID=UPI00036D7B0C|nr:MULTISPECIES: LL-diaminopimelate aminotransferase [Methanothermococcus]MDK2791066.1 LL-diaminopimelate aminotransferase [Methanothermococcus sp.]MDK2988243.1 LL-diaminopimelate aminotransferase [Methanothermococcus sp.]
MESYIQNLFAERIGGSNFGKEDVIYKFEKIKRAKMEAKKKYPNVELIDMGVGEPDEMADENVVEVLSNEAKKHENRGYADNGIQELKDAIPPYMEKVYGVKDLDPVNEVIHSMGSKPALAYITSVFINPGDVTLMTVPGYPVTATHTKWYGGDVHNLPLYEENGFLPDLESIPEDIKKRAKLLYLNYPNNPTGAQATKKFYKEVVDFAFENEVIVIQDAAYGALVYEDKPLSFLSIKDAKEVGVEIHSFSKAYNMTGWRLAFLAGNELIVKGFATVKDNYDSGQFIPIQKAGIYCLNHPEITERTRQKYERRLKKMVNILNEVGFNAKMPGGTFYLYIKAPTGTKDGVEFKNAEEFSQYLIKEKLISTVPWDDAGSYIRMAACFEAFKDGKISIEEEDRILNEVKRRLSDVEFVFE